MLHIVMRASILSHHSHYGTARTSYRRKSLGRCCNDALAKWLCRTCRDLRGIAVPRNRMYELRLAFSLRRSPFRLPCESFRGGNLFAYAAALRIGGAMNSGPTGSLIVSRKMRSISVFT